MKSKFSRCLKGGDIIIDQKELRNRMANGEKVFEYVYELTYGKQEIRKYEKKIESVCENGFKTSGFGYILPFDYFGNWRMQSWSSNSYEYYIFLTYEENIEDYLPEIKKQIANQILNEINGLQKSLKLVV